VDTRDRIRRYKSLLALDASGAERFLAENKTDAKFVAIVKLHSELVPALVQAGAEIRGKKTLNTKENLKRYKALLEEAPGEAERFLAECGDPKLVAIIKLHNEAVPTVVAAGERIRVGRTERIQAYTAILTEEITIEFPTLPQEAVKRVAAKMAPKIEELHVESCAAQLVSGG